MNHSLKIVKFPDPILRSYSQPVKEITTQWQQLAKDMIQFMYKESGVGLSAIQVNQPIRLFVADTQLKNNNRYDPQNMGELEKTITQPLTFFNPEITHQEGEVTFLEGCLSFPSYYAEVKRAKVIEVKALDGEGKPFSLKPMGCCLSVFNMK